MLCLLHCLISEAYLSNRVFDLSQSRVNKRINALVLTRVNDRLCPFSY